MSQATVKTAVDSLAEAITNNPNTAKLRYRAEVVWDGDVHCTSTVRDLPPVPVDEPAAFGGGDAAQSPGDLILTALGTCQGIMYAALASAMGIELTSYKVKLSGNLDYLVWAPIRAYPLDFRIFPSNPSLKVQPAKKKLKPWSMPSRYNARYSIHWSDPSLSAGQRRLMVSLVIRPKQHKLHI